VLVAGTAVVVLGWAAAAGAAPTKASYAAKANAVCKTYNAKLGLLTESLAGMTSMTKAEQQLDVVILASRQFNQKLQAIPRPRGESAALAKVFKLQATGIADLQRAVRSLEAGKVAGVTADLTADAATLKPVDRQFTALGLKTCAAEPSAG
jgi:hypothetical protein